MGCHRLLHTSLTHLHLLHCFCQVNSLSRVQLFATPWTVAYQAPLSMGFSRQECWSGLPFPSSGDLPDPGIEPGSSTLQADALSSEPPRKPIFTNNFSETYHLVLILFALPAILSILDYSLLLTLPCILHDILCMEFE